MKKLFLLATLAVALIFAGCANNSSKDSDKDGEKTEQKEASGKNKLSNDLRYIVEDMDKGCKEYFADEDDYEYKGVKVEDKNIIFTVQISKDELDGKNLKKWAKKEAKKDGKYYYDDMTKEQLQGYLMEKTFYDAMKDIEMDDEMKLAKELKKNKYNLVFRIVGENSEDKVELKISHKDLPDYEQEESNYGYDDEDDEYYSYEPEEEVEAVSSATTLDRTEAAVRAIEAARSMEEAYGIVLEYEDLDDEDFTPAQQERLERAFERLQ